MIFSLLDPGVSLRKHPQNLDKATVREAETSARWFSPAKSVPIICEGLWVKKPFEG
jgi:hypothetical protein